MDSTNAAASAYNMQSALQRLDDWVAALNKQMVGSAIPGYKAPQITFSGGVTNVDTLAGGLLQQTSEGTLNNLNYIDQSQGIIASSNSRDHMAIVGQGFFAVAKDLNAGTPVVYTRDGEFHKDEQGYYRTTDGSYLLSADDVDPQGNVVRDPAQFGRTGDLFGPGAMGVTDEVFNGKFLTVFQDPPSGGTGGPMNYDVDMGSVGIAYTATTAGPTNNAVWSATPMNAPKDAGYSSVGWTSNDNTADNGGAAGSLHYGQHNAASYATGNSLAQTVDVLADWPQPVDVALHVTEPGGAVTDAFDPTNNGKLMQTSTTGTTHPGGATPANNDEWYQLNAVSGRGDSPGTPITSGTYTAKVDSATGTADITYAIVEDRGTIHQATVASGTTQIGPAPKNYSVDLGAVTLSTGTGPAAGNWVATAANTGPSGSVGWTTGDTSASNGFGTAGSMHFGRHNVASYATGADAFGKLDVVVDWTNAVDIDLHVMEPDGTNVGYGFVNPHNGNRNRDVTSGGSYPGGPGFADWDEWYTVVTDSRADSPGTPADAGTYTPYVYGWSVSSPETVTYKFIGDAGTVHEQTIASGTVSVSQGASVNLGGVGASLANRTVQGTVWSPEYDLNPLIGTTNVSFAYSYGLDGAQELDAGVDKMTFQYRTFDQATSTWDAWQTVTIPKPTTSQGWTTLNQVVNSMGKTKVQFNWQFDSVDGKKNNAQGWNLEDLEIHQAAPPAPDNATLGTFNAGDRRNSGSLFSPAYSINNTMTNLDISFDYSYILGAASEADASVDQMKVWYRLDSGAWQPLSFAKGGSSQAWTNFTQNITTSGASSVQLRWDFDTVDSKLNAGRGWNLENLSLTQSGAASSNFQVQVNDLNNALNPGSTVAIYNPATNMEGPHTTIVEGTYIPVPYGNTFDWPIPNGVLRIYDDLGNLIDEHQYSPTIQSNSTVSVDVSFRRGLQPGEFDESETALLTSEKGVQYLKAADFADVPTFIPWKSTANPTNPQLVRSALEMTNAPTYNVAPQLAFAQRMYDMLTKIAMIQKGSFDQLAGLIR